MAFPFDVYAAALESEGTRVKDLHYGLFRNDLEPMAAAQARAVALIRAYLPPPGGTLAVGVDPGSSLAKQMQEAGYRLRCLAPDECFLDAVVSAKVCGRDPQCDAAESFSEAQGRWQTLLVHDGIRGLDLVELFDQTSRVLVENSHIVVLDELNKRCPPTGRRRGLTLEYFLRLAERFGFSLEARIDASEQAAGTLAWRLRALQRHGTSPGSVAGIAVTQIESLARELGCAQRDYAEGVRGYFLIKLRRVRQPRWRLGRVGDVHAGQMRALFSEVFGREMSPEHWTWKYGEGRGSGIGVWRSDGTLIAHYGGVSRDIRLFGQPSSAVQVGDVMVAASQRGILTRRGPMFLAAATFLEQEIGYCAPHLLGVGFPNATADRLAALLRLYRSNVGRMQEVRWPTHYRRPSMLTEVRPFDPRSPSGQHLINQCWKAMAASLRDHVVGVRDAAYVIHRFAEHPEKAYRFYAVRRRLTRRPRGVVVLNQLGDGSCELMDAIGARDSMPLLVAQARRITADLGCTCLSAWLVDNILQYFALPPEAIVRDLEIAIPANDWTEAPDNEAIVGAWWLTGGDVDFR